MILALIAVLVILVVVLPLIGLALWTIISVAITGVIIGGLARLILPRRQKISVLATILLGWIGSIVGGFIGFHVIGVGSILTVLIELGVAAALIALYSGSTRRKLPGRTSVRRW